MREGLWWGLRLIASSHRTRRGDSADRAAGPADRDPRATSDANATGFVVNSRGMSRGLGYRGDVMKIGSLDDIDEVRRLGGIIDYVVGTPLTKVYVLAEHPDPQGDPQAPA